MEGSPEGRSTYIETEEHTSPQRTQLGVLTLRNENDYHAGQQALDVASRSLCSNGSAELESSERVRKAQWTNSVLFSG